jgi:hypothetical protein
LLKHPRILLPTQHPGFVGIPPPQGAVGNSRVSPAGQEWRRRAPPVVETRVGMDWLSTADPRPSELLEI